MSDVCYAIYADGTREQYRNAEAAAVSQPAFMIDLSSKGMQRFRYPERTIEQEYFNVTFRNGKGQALQLGSNGWLLWELQNPIDYHQFMLVKVADPTGIIRSFGRINEQILFSSSVDGLLEVRDFMIGVSAYQSWKDLLEKIEEDDPGVPPVIVRKIRMRGL